MYNPKIRQIGGYPFPVTVCRSSRRTCQLSIRPDGQVLVRMPYFATDRDATELIEKHQEWILKKLTEQAIRLRRSADVKPFTAAQKKDMKQKAMLLIPQRVVYYEKLLGVDHSSISYRFQKTRWGSCSRKGGLNFNCLLAICPPEVLDSVVAHELCHRRHMDHSAAFYQDLERVFPEYKECRKWLKEHGSALMERL